MWLSSYWGKQIEIVITHIRPLSSVTWRCASRNSAAIILGQREVGYRDFRLQDVQTARRGFGPMLEHLYRLTRG